MTTNMIYFAILTLGVITVLSEPVINCTACCKNNAHNYLNDDSCVNIFCNGVPGSICCPVGHMATCHCVTKYGPPSCSCT